MASHSRIALASALSAALVLVAACATSPTPIADPVTAPARLDDHAWRLEGWSISSLKASDFAITAQFADGRVAGRSGVNTYSGTYALGPGSGLTFGPMAMTRMAGPEPAMRAEGVFHKLLADTRSYRLDAGRLVLLDDGGNERLIFSRTDD
jgi:heat shock protein HslJ